MNQPKKVAYVCVGAIGFGFALELVPLESEDASLKDKVYSPPKTSMEFSLPTQEGYGHTHPSEPDLGTLEAVRELAVVETTTSSSSSSRSSSSSCRGSSSSSSSSSP